MNKKYQIRMCDFIDQLHLKIIRCSVSIGQPVWQEAKSVDDEKWTSCYKALCFINYDANMTQIK